MSTSANLFQLLGNGLSTYLVYNQTQNEIDAQQEAAQAQLELAQQQSANTSRNVALSIVGLTVVAFGFLAIKKRRAA